MAASADLPTMPISGDGSLQTDGGYVSLHTLLDYMTTPPSATIGDKTALESDHPTALSLPLLPPATRPESKTASSFRPASITARRAACTHIFMERLYGEHRCTICQRPSPMGWVYCCVQDEQNLSIKEESPTGIVNVHVGELSNQHLKPEPSGNLELTHGSISAELSRSDNDAQEPTSTRLSPWIEKAILKGHYTPFQVLTMRRQRQMAIDAVAAAERHVQEYPEHSANPPKSPTIPWQDYAARLLFSDLSTVEATEVPPLLDCSVGPLEKPRMFPRCHFLACQTCRPTFRDRAWMNFEEAFAQTAPLPFINFKTDPRPLPSENTFRSIGLRVYESPIPFSQTLKRPGFYPYNALRLAGSLPYQLPPNMFITEDLGDQKAEVEGKGFRESVRRAFRGMLDRKKGSFSARSSRKRKKDHGGRESFEFDVELFMRLNDELLQEASRIPLPGHDGMDGLADEEGEVEVEEGVAVTEEGIDLGTADIIMSV